MITSIFLAIILFVLQIAILPQTRVYPSTRAQIETPIAINPTNPNNFIGTAITEVNSSFFKIGYYYSMNGGSTWQGSEDFSMDISAGDPVISFDPDGVAYIVFQVKDEKKLYMRKSTDGGVNWIPALGTDATEIFAVPGQDDILDKPWIAISPIRNSNGFFNIYITFTATYYEGSVKLPAAISLLKSTNGGSSFSGTGEFNNYDYHYLGSFVEVGPSGEVFVSYAKAELTRSKVVSIHAARSTNQGSTFQNTVEIPIIQIGLYDGNAYALKANSVRADCYPRIAVDRSPFSTGTAYLIWSAKAQEVEGNADIMMIKGSINSGQFSWNTNIISVDGSSGEQWMPAINVNPDGVLSILYYSSGSNLNDPIYTKLRYSSNGGSNFTELNVGSTNGFTITGTTFLGDYHGLTSWFGKAYCFWCENKTDPTYDERQVYFRSLDIPVPSTPANYVKTIVDQKDESNQSFEKFSRWNQEQFTLYSPPFQFLFENGANEVIRAKQDFKLNTFQKYHKWNLDYDVLNHRVFQIQTGLTSIISQFKTSQQGIIIKSLMEGIETLNPDADQIKFIDPWFIDLNESPYGKRNRGMADAYPWERPSPFYPDDTTSYDGDVYKGVFLNQGWPGWNPPYYSAGAISPQPIQIQHSINPPITLNHNFYFQNWSANPSGSAEFQDANALQTPVVFKQEGATVQANMKGTQLSNDQNAFANNSQRKFVRTLSA